MADDFEPGLAVHEFGEIEGGDAGIVGDEADLARGAEFDERHGPAAAFFDDFDSAGLDGAKRGGEREQTENEGERTNDFRQTEAKKGGQTIVGDHEKGPGREGLQHASRTRRAPGGKQKIRPRRSEGRGFGSSGAGAEPRRRAADER